MIKPLSVFLLLLLVLTACVPIATDFPLTATPELPSPTMTAPVPAEPNPIVVSTAEPTLEPIQLPVDRFTSLPGLSPLTSENIKSIEAVATFKEAQLVDVKISTALDRAAFAFGNGIQIFELPGLASSSFLPFDLHDISGHRIFQLSPDAHYMAVVQKTTTGQAGNTVTIWDLKTQRKTCSLTFEAPISPGGSGPFRMEFYPESNLFLFDGRLDHGNNNYTSEVRLVNITSCNSLFKQASQSWPTLAVSPDGHFLAYVKEGQNQTYLLNTQDNSEKPVGDAGNLRGVGFTLDSKAVIVANSYLTQMYDLMSGAIMATLEVNLGRDLVYLYPLRDGHCILMAGNKSNRIWDYVAGTSYSPGNEFISGYQELFDDYFGVIFTTQIVWNLESKTQFSLKKYPYGRQASAISQDGRYLAVESGYTPWQTDLIDLATNQLIARFPGERAPVAVGETFITSGERQSFFHRFENGELVTTVDFEYMNGKEIGNNHAVLWNTQGNLRLLEVSGTFTAQGKFSVFPLSYYNTPDIYTSRHALPAWEATLGYDPTPLLSSIGRDTALMAPDGQSAVLMSDNAVQIFRITDETFFPTSDTLLAVYPFDKVWFRFAFSPDSALIAGRTYNQLYIWDAKTGKQVSAFIGKDFLKNAWYNIEFSLDGQLIALDSIGQKDRTLTILNSRSGHEVRAHSVSNCMLDIPLVFAPDGNNVFTVTSDCRIAKYSLADWQKSTVIGGPYSGAKLALALSTDGKLLAVGHKSTLEIWDTQTSSLLKHIDLETGIENFLGNLALEFSPDGSFLAARYGANDSLFLDTTVTIFGIIDSQ